MSLLPKPLRCDYCGNVWMETLNAFAADGSGPLPLDAPLKCLCGYVYVPIIATASGEEPRVVGYRKVMNVTTLAVSRTIQPDPSIFEK